MKLPDKFDRESLEFWLPKTFKGLTKQYILDCIFNEKIQSHWYPEEGDIIVGETGNIYVISGLETLHESIGGDMFFFGGQSCNRDGGIYMESTMSYTMNQSGLIKKYTGDKFTMVEHCNHSKFSDFRFVPYPHETNRIY